MSIYFHTEVPEFNYSEKERTKRWLRAVMKEEKKYEGEINIIFTDEESILQLNKKYLSHNYFTDVIAFNYNEGDLIKGDIYISIDTVRANAQKYKSTFSEELHRVIVHGLLHLIGCNDKTPTQKEKMKEKEAWYLSRF